jgi:hypothetical protein
MSASYKLKAPLNLTDEQIFALHRRLRDMRHDVNGRLANIVAAAELIRLRPEAMEDRLRILLDQPHQAADAISHFSKDFETAFGLVRE